MAEEIKSGIQDRGEKYGQLIEEHKNTGTRLGEREKADDKEQFLRGFWARIHGGNASTTFLNVYKNVSFEELRPDAGIITPPLFEGTPEDAILHARSAVEDRKNNRRQLAALYNKSISNTLVDWELRGEADPEKSIDLIVMPLARNAIKPLASQDTASFAAGLEQYLRENAPKPLTEGYCKTWGALADWMVKSGYRICKTWGVTAYSRLICAILHEQNPAGDILNLLAADANSLASSIDDLGERRDKQLEFMNRCHLLTPLYRAVPEFEADRKQLVTEVMELIELSGDSKQQLEHAWMLSQMMRISRAWELLDPTVFTLLDSPVDTEVWEKNRYNLPPLLRCTAALLLICLVDEDDFDEPVSSFFNATVALNRLVEIKSQHQQKAIALRALVGGIGLWWALRATGDIRQALGSFNGFDCLVNMFGALSDIPSLVKNKPNALKLANEVLPYGEQADKMRLLVSLQQLGMEPEKESDVGIDQLREYTELLLVGIMSHDDKKGLDRRALNTRDLRKPVIYWAGVLMPRVRALLNAVGNDGTYSECTGLIKNLLQNLSVLKGKGPAFISKQIWRREEMEGVALLDTAGIRIPDAWREAFDAYKDGPPPSLAEFVRDHAAKVFEAPR